MCNMLTELREIETKTERTKRKKKGKIECYQGFVVANVAVELEAALLLPHANVPAGSGASELESVRFELS